jgi:hypothetical protein
LFLVTFANDLIKVSVEEHRPALLDLVISPAEAL